MTLYKEEEGSLNIVKNIPFESEGELQKLCEENLEELFNLKFIASEFSVENFRIDTLAFDEELKCFVIIEYKNTRSFSVIDQGYAYLSTMLNNKSDFILKFIEKTGNIALKDKFDWSQSRVYFVAPRFTDYQRESINFKDLPIYLHRIRKYAGGLIDVDSIKPKKSSASINTILPSEEQNKVKREIRIYTEEDHVKNVSDKILDLYNELKQAILDIDDNIETRYTKIYIAFDSNNKTFCTMNLRSSRLKMWLNLNIGQLEDPKDMHRDVSKIGHWGLGDYEFEIKEKEELYYVIDLIKQTYRVIV
jgi:predicted transport protein